MLKKTIMLKLTFLLLFSVLTLSSITGCIVAAAGAGAAVTYTVTGDSITDKVKYSKETLIEHFVDIVKEEKGMLLYVSISEGKIKAEIGKKKVYFDAKKIDNENTSIKISVRKGYQLLPDKEEALRLYKKLAVSLQ